MNKRTSCERNGMIRKSRQHGIAKRSGTMSNSVIHYIGLLHETSIKRLYPIHYLTMMASQHHSNQVQHISRLLSIPLCLQVPHLVTFAITKCCFSCSLSISTTQSYPFKSMLQTSSNALLFRCPRSPTPLIDLSC